MLKAILFDLDDTLIDWSGFNSRWEAMEVQHLNRVFEYICRQHRPLDSFELFVTEYATRTRSAWESARNNLRAPHLGRILVDTACALGIPNDVLDMRRCLEEYRWSKVEGTVLFPDVDEALTLFRTRGLKMGIVTNAHQPMWIRDHELEVHGLLKHFPSCRFSAADVGYLKPHPNIFEMALKCLGTEAEETLFVGDNPVADIAGAQGAGLRAVLRVKNPAPLLLSGLVVPDGAINSLMELPAILDLLYPGW
jgi:putative hydrolase of the HAD superfamily